MSDESKPKRSRRAKVEPESVIPEYVQQARIMQKRRVTKRRLPSYTEAMMLLHAPEAQRLFWKALLEGLNSGDREAMRMTGEIFDLVKKGGGISITQNLLQQNAVAGATSPVVGFDAFARQLAEKRAGHALPAPQDDIIDVHPVDSAGG
jgi:hypothetical protein